MESDSEAWTTARGTMFREARRRRTSPTTGTVLRKSCLPLRGWCLAMRLACTRKTGLSPAGLQRELGPDSHRTAWLLPRRLRSAMVRLGRERMQGVIKVDEACARGADKGM